MSETTMNEKVILLVGKSTAGKSASLRHLRNPEEVVYLNCDAGKRLPFKSKFTEHTITDPLQVVEAIQHYENDDSKKVIVIDTITFLMDMYEALYVQTAADTRKAWGHFAMYWKELMQKHIAGSSKTFILIAHTLEVMNESEMVLETKVPIKGALKNQGIEAYFTVVVAAKRVRTKDLDKYKEGNNLLNVTEEENMLKFKHVIQTRINADTVHERLRSPLDLFSLQETFIDGNMQAVIDRLDEFYE